MGMRMNPNLPTGPSRNFVIILLATAVVLSLSAGGCVSYRKYVMVDGSEKAGIFEGYDFGVWLGHYYSEEDSDTCFLNIWQEYRPSQSDTVRMDSLCEIKISLLCVELDCTGGSFCPLADYIEIDRSHNWKDGVLKGPYYSFGIVLIPRKCKQIHVSFVATLIESETGEELERRPVKLTLQRKTG
jgi:hypothetical protein